MLGTCAGRRTIDGARTPPAGSAESEPARAFLQDRIVLWAAWVFVLSFGFYVTNIASWPLVRRGPGDVGDAMLQAGNLDHLAATIVFGGVALFARRVQLSMPTLRALDLVTLIVGCVLFALMGACLLRMQISAGVEASIGMYAGLLACGNTVVARAIAVPSSARRTLAASAMAMAPLAPAAYVATSGSAAATLNIAAWCAVAVAVATVGSQVIFGLRTEAARVKRLGQYTLETRIGAGGMGVVYRARHAMLRRPTAIKLLPPDRAGEESLARFEREVQMTAQLSHPNTVAVYDYGRTPDGVFYYAMEYLDGINLQDLVRVDGPQPPGRVVAILDQVCGALSEAHERGLVHRDIKPANIILTERGGEPDVAKVVDFGLVRPLASGDPGHTGAVPNTLTGTPPYMSPEALTQPDSVDPRSDLYALGAVGYFLLTGRPVFEPGSVVQLMAQHLRAEPPPPSRRVDRPVPHDLEALILRCLRKRPADRPESARALRDALRRCSAVSRWTAEDAGAWWRAFRSPGGPRGDASGALGVEPGDSLTVTVDLSNRLQQVAG
jgi:eukaryotic-like serine/threonine-protein kinase